MNYSYDVHSWSKLYREEKLAEARRRHLAERARTGREPRELGRSGLSWNPLMQLRRALFSQ
jgi:hypothetical protein